MDVHELDLFLDTAEHGRLGPELGQVFPKS